IPTGNRQRSETFFQFIERHAAVEQRGERHIAGNSGEAIEISCFHNFSATDELWSLIFVLANCENSFHLCHPCPCHPCPSVAIPLIMEAANAAAPKPLSILTTATPLAQVLSIPSSAATPPKLAP